MAVRPQLSSPAGRLARLFSGLHRLAPAVLAALVFPATALAQSGVQFDGSNDRITFGTASPLGTPTFTLEVWFMRTGMGVTTTTGTGGVTNAIPLLTKGRGEAEGSVADMNYFLGIRASDNVLVADYEEGTGQTMPGLNHPVAGVTPIRSNVWYHAAAAFDGSTWRLYLNGVLEATSSVGTSRLPQSASTQHAGLASAFTSTGAAGGFFAGILDEARIWGHARPGSGIRDSMTLELATAPGLLGRWGLNDNGGTVALNSVAGSPNGTLVNGPAWVGGSPFALRNALSFQGTNAYVAFGDPAALDLAQFTIETWFRRDGAGIAAATSGAGGGVTAVPLLTKGRSESDGSTVDANFFLGIRFSDNVLAADFEEGAAGALPGENHPIAGVTPIINGTWYHAAATYDGNKWQLFLNGALEAELVVGQPVQSSSIQHAALGSALNSTGVAAGFFHGVLDEARVWDGARTQAQIMADMNAQIASATAGLVARWGLDEGAGTTVNGSAGTSVNGTITGAAWGWSGPAPFDAAPPTPPLEPSGLVATAITHRQVRTTWTDNANNEANFEVERSTTGAAGTFLPLATLPANTAAFIDTDVSTGGEYCYRVRATNVSGQSGWAGPVCATTPAADLTALDLGGTNAYVTFGDAAPLHLGQFTIETWFRRDGPGIGTDTGAGGIPSAIPLFARGRAEAEGAALDVNYFFGLRASDGVLCADFEEGVAGTSPSLNHPVVGTTAIAIGTWHHGAVTYNGADWKLYLDGNLEATLVVGQPPAAASAVAASLGSALRSTGEAAGFFDGVLDEVRIWEVARTQVEIQSAANARLTAPQAGLVARWALDEGVGTAVNGSAGTTIPGTVVGANYVWQSPGAPFDLSLNLPPDPPALVAPAHQATGIAPPPDLTVSVSDPDADSLTVTWYGRPVLTPAPGPDFTLIGIPDTQYYVSSLNGGSPAIFDSQTQWIVDQRASRNIVYAVQLGDCTENGDAFESQWQEADQALSLIENPVTTGLPEGIPYGVSVGNHDQSPGGSATGTTNFYNQYFGTARFGGRAYYGGHYGDNNDNWYQLFSASGLDFIVISFEYDTAPDAPVLAWADSLLAAHSNRRAIVASHWIIGTGNPASFSAQGQATYDALKDRPNLFLMLCGHVTDEGRRLDTFNGNTVRTVLSDYQGRTAGGNGWLRIMEFSPANNVIRVRTYSPWLGQFEADADSSSQFTLPYEMSSTPPFQQIGATSDVPSGSNAAMAWPSLDSFTQYEWYVTVSDGVSVATSPTWRFTTGDGVSPSVQLVAPNGGEVFSAGGTTNIEWTATDNVDVTSIDLELSRTGAGGPYTPIATGLANSGTYSWSVDESATTDAHVRVVAHDAAGNNASDVSDSAFTITATAAVGDATVVEFELGPPSPNPLPGRGTFDFAVPRAARVRLTIMDVQGREVAVLADAAYAPGRYTLVWDGRVKGGSRASVGLYILRLQAPGHHSTRRFALMR